MARLLGLLAMVITLASGSPTRATKVSPELHRMQRDLSTLTRHPDGRNWEIEKSYYHVATWLARRLRKSGIAPAGTGPKGVRSYLQPFEVEMPDGTKRSWNVAGILPGDGSTKEAVLVVAHLDGLGTAVRRSENVVGRYQGANDNASAVAVALSIGHALARRS